MYFRSFRLKWINASHVYILTLLSTWFVESAHGLSSRTAIVPTPTPSPSSGGGILDGITSGLAPPTDSPLPPTTDDESFTKSSQAPSVLKTVPVESNNPPTSSLADSTPTNPSTDSGSIAVTSSPATVSTSELTSVSKRESSASIVAVSVVSNGSATVSSEPSITTDGVSDSSFPTTLSSNVATSGITIQGAKNESTRITIGIVLGCVSAVLIATIALIALLRKRRSRSKGLKEKFNVAPYDQKHAVDTISEQPFIHIAQRGKRSSAVETNNTSSIQPSTSSDLNQVEPRSGNQSPSYPDSTSQNQRGGDTNDLLSEAERRSSETRTVGTDDRNPSRSLRNAVAMIMDHVRTTNGQPEAVVRSMFVSVDVHNEPPPAYS
ncbi:hypothetical protein VKT23_018423 [Stygiomarasmius scandens]|uniref:Mid2 domain-containing protein n=1 Tax=Marasmiellus scandens TaxID=2682957 RepID=A0ABR1IPF4_9AGAR